MTLRFIGSLIILVATALFVNAQEGKTIDELVEQLGHGSFEKRNEASQVLSRMGVEILPDLEKSLVGLSPEGAIRGLHVIRGLVMQTESESSDLAFAALRRIAESEENATVARKSAGIIKEVEAFLKLRIASELQVHGAVIQFKSVDVPGKISVLPYTIEINESWSGEPELLKKIGLLDNLEEIRFAHPSVNDELVSSIVSLKLKKLTFRKCGITNVSVVAISKMRSLRDFSVFYIDIDEGCVNALKSMRYLTRLRLYGTLIGQEHETVLQAKIADVDIRKGAFLGIRYTPGTDTCRLTDVVENSAAASSGLRVGDTIVEFKGEKIGAPTDLIAALRVCEVGETAALKVIRRNEEIELELEFGEWNEDE